MSSWNINPTTKDFVSVNGSPVSTESLTIPAYIRLKTKRLKWLYAPDSNYGSDFYLLQKRQSTKDASNVEAVAVKALQPMIDDGRATEIEVSADIATRNAVGMTTKIVDARGEPDLLVIPSLGV